MTLSLHVVSSPVAPPTSMGIIAYGLYTGAKIQNNFESKEVFEEKDNINNDYFCAAGRQGGRAALGFFIFHFEYAVV